jgi:hypothetical protein
MNSYITPSLPKYKLEESNNSIKVSIANINSKLVYILLLVFFFIFWIAYGGLLIYLYFIITIPNKTFEIPPIAYLSIVIWLMSGIIIPILYIWRISLKTEIEVNEQEIHVLFKSYINKKKMRYKSEFIKELRSSPLPASGILTGPIAFDYGAKTIRIGLGLDEAEAKQIIEKIKLRYKNY